ncbi:MAG: TetR/AcrR family transcriptional regulator [Clostridium sp.]|nr:TetR/AcrR family transcriptional regulator [Clostridium sp.]MCM1444457.1 TetR/AcrR family transcriptional regulator [Candidatus Amulumruptor caecigallinarius]
MKKEVRKKELIKIAYELFVTKGYENTSVDEIIAKAGIAKGTYYYHFESKEQMLEEVINVMVNEEVDMAKEVLNMPISIPEKLVGVITSLRPKIDEEEIKNALNKKENIVMHEKINNRIIEEAIPLLERIVNEGIENNMFNCNHIKERLKMLLIMSNELFDDDDLNINEVEVFIDTTEKMLGAKQGTLQFIKMLIQGGKNE